MYAHFTVKCFPVGAFFTTSAVIFHSNIANDTDKYSHPDNVNDDDDDGR